MADTTSNLAKLTIHGLCDAKADPSFAEGDTFTAMVNPETVTVTRSIKFEENNESNSAGASSQFASIGEDTISFDLMFDGTGLLDIETGKGSTDVMESIEKLEKIAYNYEGDIHRPQYLILVYGSIVFRCQLKDMKTDFTLFKPDGSPLRAKSTITMIGRTDPDTREKLAKKSSPDLTHVKTVRDGDSLPLLCQDVYGDFKYYLQVANANGLSNFRELEVGSTIFFPPLD